MAADEPQHPEPPRRWQFSLWGILVGTAVATIAFAATGAFGVVVVFAVFGLVDVAPVIASGVAFGLTVILAVFLLAKRLFRPLKDSQQRRWQFSLGAIFGLTAVAAVLAAVFSGTLGRAGTVLVASVLVAGCIVPLGFLVGFGIATILYRACTWTVRNLRPPEDNQPSNLPPGS